MPTLTTKARRTQAPRQAPRLAMWLAMWLVACAGALPGLAGAAGVVAAAGWTPKASDTFHLQLQGTVDTTHEVVAYDIDLVDTPDSVMQALHAQGRRVICYFSAGTAEDWRPDYDQFQAGDKGKALGDWPGEYWLDTRSANVRRIMQARLDKAKARGCDAIDADNVDEHLQDTGFPLTHATQLDYNRFIAREAHRRGLQAGLKNDLDQLADLSPDFDFAVNEQCHVYQECERYGAFIAADKPVFNAEYKKRWHTDAAARERLCASARAMNMRTVVYPRLLNGKYRDSCD